MRRGRRDGILGFLIGLIVGRSRLPWWALGVILLIPVWLAVRVWAWWTGLVLGAQLIIIGLAIVAAWAWLNMRRRPARPVPGWEHRDRLPRTTVDPFWVYIISEWRDGRDRIIRREHGNSPGAIRHLVYIGKANDLDNRIAQHTADKPWWHDELHIDVIRCNSEQEALNVERRLINQAAASPRLTERPRENRQHNPSYSAARSASMLARAGVPR